MKNSTATSKGTCKGGFYNRAIAALYMQDTKAVCYLSSAFGLKVTGGSVRRKQKKKWSDIKIFFMCNSKIL